MGDCVVCTQPFDDDDLLFGDRGPTCAPCMVATDEGTETTKHLWTLVIAPPVILALAVFTPCIPIIGLFACMLMSCVALAGGLNAIQTGYRLDAVEQGVAPEMKTYLLVSGSVTSAISVVLTGLLVVLLSLFVVSLAM